jgi:hypothetical protein
MAKQCAVRRYVLRPGAEGGRFKKPLAGAFESTGLDVQMLFLVVERRQPFQKASILLVYDWCVS